MVLIKLFIHLRVLCELITNDIGNDYVLGETSAFTLQYFNAYVGT